MLKVNLKPSRNANP